LSEAVEAIWQFLCVVKKLIKKALNDDERKTIYTMLDAFIGKKKLKDALSNVLHDVH
jgi:hypothetical protein